MANVDPIFVVTPQSAIETIAAADTTTKKTIYTAGISGGALISLSAVNNDTTNSVIVELYINDGATSTQIGSVLVAAKAGTDGVVPASNLLDPAMIRALQNDGSIVIKANYSIQVAASATVSANVDIVGVAGDY